MGHKNNENYSVVVEEYENTTPDINRINYKIINCGRML